jgi:hypothetical protein
MRRNVLTLFVLAALCAWVSAQGPPPLTAEIQVKQFKNNRILIENLVDDGIYISSSDDSLARAQACQRTARTLANYLERAAGDGDPDRVAEFAGLFGQVIREGLLPNLDAARKSTSDLKSPRAGTLKTVNDGARSDIEGVLKSIPTDGKVGDNDKVKSAVRAIEELAGKFGG